MRLQRRRCLLPGRAGWRQLGTARRSAGPDVLRHGGSAGILGECCMRARRYDRILAGAALALMLALPLRALAQDAGTTDAVKVQRGKADSSGPAAVATATTPAKESQVEAPAAPA